MKHASLVIVLVVFSVSISNVMLFMWPMFFDQGATTYSTGCVTTFFTQDYTIANCTHLAVRDSRWVFAQHKQLIRHVWGREHLIRMPVFASGLCFVHVATVSTFVLYHRLFLCVHVFYDCQWCFRVVQTQNEILCIHAYACNSTDTVSVAVFLIIFNY